MDWIYISPHLDDVALSCGGLIWEQTQTGNQVGIWTLFTSDPPEGPLSDFAKELHTRWQGGQESIARRRSEDTLSCARIGASPRHFAYPDCIYRSATQAPNNRRSGQAMNRTGENEFFYNSKESLFGPIHPAEIGLVEQLSLDLAESLPQETELVCPLALGEHVDHRLTRSAVEKLGRRLWYFADYPYVAENLEEIEAMDRSGWRKSLFLVSPAGMEAWEEAVAAHQSQISTFWPNLEAMKQALEDYLKLFGGIVLWQLPESV